MEIFKLKGDELDEWLQEERKRSITYLEDYYKKERLIDKEIEKIHKIPNKRYILIKDRNNKIIIEGEIEEQILRLLIKEGYKTNSIK